MGKTFVYEFTLLRPGSHFYHTHLDEQLQLALGMYGCLVVHPKDPRQLKVDRDFMFMLASYDVEPGAMTPKASTMTEFNMWTWNNRVFPGIDPLVARTGDRVRIRIGNLTMTNHPIHMHGPHFEVTGTDGGWVSKAARWPEVTTDIGVGQLRAIEFDAVAGDWAIHCHKSHHTMNAMGHNIPTMVGVDHRGLAERITKLVPDYMVMGDKGMHDMAEMEMPHSGQHAADDDRQGAVRPRGHGRHVQRREGPRRRAARRLQGSGSVQAPAGHCCLRVHGPAPRAGTCRRRQAKPACQCAALRPQRPLKTGEHMKYAVRISLQHFCWPADLPWLTRTRRTPAPRKFDASQVEATPFGQEGDPKKVTRTIRVVHERPDAL